MFVEEIAKIILLVTCVTCASGMALRIDFLSWKLCYFSLQTKWFEIWLFLIKSVCTKTSARRKNHWWFCYQYHTSAMASVTSIFWRWRPYLWWFDHLQNVDRNVSFLFSVNENRFYQKWILLQLNSLFRNYSFARSDPANIEVRAGSSTHNNGGKLYAVKRIVKHSKFDTTRTDYDFSLLELQEPIEFDETKRAIELHNFDEVFTDNTTTLVSGWGYTAQNESSLQLQAGEIWNPILSKHFFHHCVLFSWNSTCQSEDMSNIIHTPHSTNDLRWFLRTRWKRCMLRW